MKAAFGNATFIIPWNALRIAWRLRAFKNMQSRGIVIGGRMHNAFAPVRLRFQAQNLEAAF
jgi:hypothetical protein